MQASHEQDRSVRWERRLEWPLLGVSLFFLAAYAVPIIAPAAPNRVLVACDVVVLISWLLFAGDYLFRLVIAEDRRRFVRRNLLDLAILALPLLRPLRLLRLAVLLSVLNRAGSGSLRGRVAVYVTGGAMLMVLCAGLAITEAERGQPDSTIQHFGDGIWWAVTTMTTVGYGDTSPVTVTGRVIAVALMVGGVALLGVVTASLASWMVERVAETAEAEQGATRTQVEELGIQIALLRAEVTQLKRVEVGRGDEAHGRGRVT